MRNCSIAAAVLLGIAIAGTPSYADSWRSAPHVRPLGPRAAAFLADASRRSIVVSELVASLARTDVVVFLEDGYEGCAGGVRACLTFVTSAAGVRYVLVRIDRWRIAPWDRIAWLAHELQHAVEIAGAPEVQDSSTLARFYGRVGWHSGRGLFETSLARAAGDLARSQLAAARPPAPPSR